MKDKLNELDPLQTLEALPSFLRHKFRCASGEGYKTWNEKSADAASCNCGLMAVMLALPAVREAFQTLQNEAADIRQKLAREQESHRICSDVQSGKVGVQAVVDLLQPVHKEQYAREFDGELKELFILSPEESRALYDYLLNRAGYVSYEFDMPVILLIRRLRELFD